jgi:hypothetical protein
MRTGRDKYFIKRLDKCTKNGTLIVDEERIPFRS